MAMWSSPTQGIGHARRPYAHVLRRRLVAGWGATPTQLRVVRAALVIVCVVGGAVCVVSAKARIDATTEIQQRAGPLSVDAIDVYRSLAAADAFLATEFLDSAPGATSVHREFDDAMATAASRLVHAGSLADERGLTATRLASITSQLSVYTEHVGRARALGPSAGQGDLADASKLMQSTILRRAEALQRGEARRLDDQYRRARSFPSAALASCLLALTGLAAAQLLVYRKTRRLVNVGLAGGTAIVVGALLWSVLAGSISAGHLERAERRSDSVTGGLGLARIAAFQARSNELLDLVYNSETYRNNFQDKAQLLVRVDPKGSIEDLSTGPTWGGALGAALRRSADEPSRARVKQAIKAASNWKGNHDWALDRRNSRHRDVVNAPLAPLGDGPGASFRELDTLLADAVAAEDAAFRRDMRQAASSLEGLILGTAALALAAAAAAIWGIGQRLEEYR